ncbi:MAG: hypothetical protein HRT67_00190 [Flavobacteriaceae bacterium]|nr:hypothetical protein [Flavobacteriaceae bacterium]
MIDKKHIRQLLKDFEVLKQENKKLRLRIAELEEKLSTYENPKNSGNSCISPSEAQFKKAKS